MARKLIKRGIRDMGQSTWPSAVGTRRDSDGFTLLERTALRRASIGATEPYEELFTLLKALSAPQRAKVAQALRKAADNVDAPSHLRAAFKPVTVGGVRVSVRDSIVDIAPAAGGDRMSKWADEAREVADILERGRARKNPSLISGPTSAKRRAFYVTTFCNFAHDVRTGRPIDHECYILSPKALQAEMDGDFALAGEIGMVKKPRQMVTGRARKNPDRPSNDDSEDALVQARRAIRPDKRRSSLRAVRASYFDQAVRGYIAAALWSSTDDDGASLDAEFSESDFSEEARDRAEQDVNQFIVNCGDRNIDVNAHDPEQLGHDFWLTRNRHGTGFWDRDLGSEGKILTDLAHSFGEVDIYVGDDGELYFSR